MSLVVTFSLFFTSVPQSGTGDDVKTKLRTERGFYLNSCIFFGTPIVLLVELSGHHHTGILTNNINFLRF